TGYPSALRCTSTLTRSEPARNAERSAGSVFPGKRVVSPRSAMDSIMLSRVTKIAAPREGNKKNVRMNGRPGVRCPKCERSHVPDAAVEAKSWETLSSGPVAARCTFERLQV